MSIKNKLKELFHRHKFRTLLIFTPHSTNKYDFLLRCDCGYTKLTKLPYTITEISEVKRKRR